MPSIYSRVFNLLIEGSMGLKRLGRVEKAIRRKTSLGFNSTGTPEEQNLFKQFSNNNLKQHIKLKSKDNRSSPYVTDRILKSYAKLPYDKWLKIANSNNHLHWHGNSEGYYKPDFRRTSDKAIHAGTKAAARHRIGFPDPYKASDPKQTRFNDQLRKNNRTFTSTKSTQGKYSVRRQNHRLIPLLIKKSDKVADFSKNDYLRKDRPEMKFRKIDGQPIFRYNRDEQSNMLLGKRAAKFHGAVVSTKALKKDSDFNFASPKKNRENREKNLPQLKKSPDIVKYKNNIEDKNSISHAVTKPSLVHTYKDNVRRHGDLTKSMKTGKKLNKPKTRHMRRSMLDALKNRSNPNA